jgi:thioredoxin-like negative regulator of GroEL
MKEREGYSMADGNKCILLKNQQELDKALKANGNALVLFYASWCPFCARFLPEFKKCADRSSRIFLLVEDDQEVIADKYSINIFPTVLFFQNGAVAKRLDGAAGIGLQEKQLEEFVNSCPQSD